MLVRAFLGGDMLSKFVGDGEFRVRRLFEMAKAQQPSIIFFDELDGIAPVRDHGPGHHQVHNSIVSTP